jgi:hypothetical protein
MCPGLYDPSERILVENSLRSYLSPRYFNLPQGLSQGTDTMFGRTTSAGRNYLNTVSNLPSAQAYLDSNSTLTEAGMINRPNFAPASYLLYERRV